ncbi:MAG: hypothetical protein ACREIA_06075 [Opitutaceae bacterium]
MKTTRPKKTLFVSCCALLAGAPLAVQAQAGGAVSSATSAAADLNGEVARPLPGENPVMPSRLPDVPVNPRAVAEEGKTIAEPEAAPLEPEVEARADANANAKVQAPKLRTDASGEIGVVVDPKAEAVQAGVIAGALTASLNREPMTKEIRAAEHAEASTVTGQIEGRLEASASGLDELETQGERLRGAERKAFKRALAQAHDEERALRKSLKNARKASAEEWTEARAELAKAYDAYAVAVAEAEVAAGRTAEVSNDAEVSNETEISNKK